MSIREVSAACGFNSMSYFSQSFLQAFGKKPSEYRQAWPEKTNNIGNTKTSNNNNTLVYKEIRKDTDLTYTPQPNGIKEEIIIHKPNQDTTYTFL